MSCCSCSLACEGSRRLSRSRRLFSTSISWGCVSFDELWSFFLVMGIMLCGLTCLAYHVTLVSSWHSGRKSFRKQVKLFLFTSSSWLSILLEGCVATWPSDVSSHI